MIVEMTVQDSQLTLFEAAGAVRVNHASHTRKAVNVSALAGS